MKPDDNHSACGHITNITGGSTMMGKNLIALKKKSLAISTLSLAIAALGTSQSHAYSFDIGEIDAAVNSSISVGASWRLAKPMKGTTPIAEGGSLVTSNYDNGSLNYERGEMFSQIFKGVHDIELRYKNFGMFFRGRYWYDAALKDKQSKRRYRIPDQALDDSGAGAELLDAFAWVNFDLPIGDEGLPVNLRYGRQVVSWGESTFIQNSINVINPVDVSTFHKPGAQIKEALLPVEMLFGSIGLTDELSFEAFYQIKWDHTRVDACNTYFALIDYLPPGCDTLNASFGNLTQEQVLSNVAIPLLPGAPPVSTGLDKKATFNARDSGQFGLAFRYYAESLNDTEFGIYFINYHARRPLVGAYGSDPAVAFSTMPNGYLNLGSGYFVEYVEDIRLYGVSFNTTVGDTALSGELSFRPNQFLQKNFGPVVWAALDPLSPSLQAAGVLPPDVRLGDFSATDSNVVTGERIRPDVRFPVLQGQLTMIQFFEQVLGGERLTLIGEVGFVRVNGAPSKGEFPMFGPIGGDSLLPVSPYNSTQSAALGGATIAACGIVAPEEACTYENTGDAFSWGYRLLASLEYGDVFRGVKLTPSFYYTHDVNGSSPFPIGNFEEDVKSLGVSLKADYLNKYEVTVSYTNFFDGNLNLLRDRDFASLSMSYNF